LIIGALGIGDFVFSSCGLVDRSVCPEKQGRSTKSHEPTRNSLPRNRLLRQSSDYSNVRGEPHLAAVPTNMSVTLNLFRFINMNQENRSKARFCRGGKSLPKKIPPLAVRPDYPHLPLERFRSYLGITDSETLPCNQFEHTTRPIGRTPSLENN